jgi:hypothetical protein
MGNLPAMRAQDRRRGASLVLATILAATLVLTACASGDRELAAPDPVVEAPAQPTTTEAPTTPTTAVPTTAATTTEQATTERPATTAATTTTTAATTTTEAGGEDGDGVDWGLVALIAGIALAVVLLLWLVISQVSRTSREHDTLDRRIAHLVGGAQWVHDQASLELMSGTQSPERLRAAWIDTRRRVNDLATQASEAAVTARGDVVGELRQLSTALTALGGAMDTNVDLRLRPQGTDAGAAIAINESAETVNERRHALRAAIAPLAARV